MPAAYSHSGHIMTARRADTSSGVTIGTRARKAAGSCGWHRLAVFGKAEVGMMTAMRMARASVR